MVSCPLGAGTGPCCLTRVHTCVCTRRHRHAHVCGHVCRHMHSHSDVCKHRTHTQAQRGAAHTPRTPPAAVHHGATWRACMAPAVPRPATPGDRGPLRVGTGRAWGVDGGLGDAQVTHLPTRAHSRSQARGPCVPAGSPPWPEPRASVRQRRRDCTATQSTGEGQLLSPGSQHWDTA